MKAIIAAAGWKGAGADVGLVGCPEPFLPLGDGTTTLSRTATTLIDNGYEVYTAIGRLGYPFNRYIRWSQQNHLPKFGNQFQWDTSPWTLNRYEYAAQFGEVLEMPDPGGWTTSLDTLCQAMDMIGEENWDHLLLLCGDMLIPRDCFAFMLTCEIPFILSFTHYHAYFGLDKEGARFFRDYSEPFRRFKDGDAWVHDKKMSPHCLGVPELQKAGFNIYGRDAAPDGRWCDIDIAQTYQNTRDLVAAEKEQADEA